MSEKGSRDQELAALVESQVKDDKTTKVYTTRKEHVVSNLGRYFEDESYEDRFNKLGFDKRNPEALLMAAESMQMTIEKVKQLSEDHNKIFLAIMDNGSVEEISSELSLSPRSVVLMIRELLAVIHPHYAKMFEKQLKAKQPDVEITKELSESDLPSEKPTFDEISGRVILTELMRVMSLDRLHAYLNSCGYEISRVTAYRAKKSGWFNPSYFKEGGDRVLKGKFVELTADEKLLDVEVLASQFGVGLPSARRMKQQGYLHVDSINTKYRDRLKIDPSRIKQELVGYFAGSRRILLTETKNGEE